MSNDEAIEKSNKIEEKVEIQAQEENIFVFNIGENEQK